VLGLNLGGSGTVTDQEAENYCATHQADKRLSTQTLNQLNVLSNDALSAWSHCLDNEKQGLISDVSTNAATGAVTIALRYAGSGSIQVKGVTLTSPVNPPPITCTHNTTGLLGQSTVQTVGPTTRFDLKSGTTETINCKQDISVLAHPPTNPRNVTVTVATDLSPVEVPLYDPQYTVASRSDLSTLTDEISKLRARVDALEVVRTESGVFSVTQGLRGSGTSRSVQNRVTFAHPFTMPPRVMISIAGYDDDSGTPVRVSTSVDAVDTNGFSFSVGTWNISSIYSIGISWVALGK
jgi:H-type lectin domain